MNPQEGHCDLVESLARQAAAEDIEWDTARAFILYAELTWDQDAFGVAVEAIAARDAVKGHWGNVTSYADVPLGVNLAAYAEWFIDQQDQRLVDAVKVLAADSCPARQAGRS